MRILPFLIALSAALPARAEDAPRVVTDIPPIHSLAALLMHGVGEPVLLLDEGADPHHFQLRPSQMRNLADADLVVWVGPQLTPWLDRALDSLGNPQNQVALVGDHAPEQEEEHGHEAEHHDEHGHEAEHHDEHEDETGHHDEHGHGADIHAWLDPAVAVDWTNDIATALIKADPANAELYQANLADAQRRIIETSVTVREVLQTAQDGAIIVGHDAYDSFANAFGLTIAGSVADSDAARPGAARLAELRGLVADKGTVCLFPEALEDPTYMQDLAQDTGAQLGGALDPAGAVLTPGPDLYSQLLIGLAQTIADCLDAE